MQVYAFDEHQKRIFIEDAKTAHNYLCIECGEPVRARCGTHRQHHFYHLHPQGVCKLKGKSVEHILIQQLLQHNLDASCEQEVPFKEINRIADVVWFSQKIVLEVQCSPITKEEVAARIRDYESVGFKVIWILYDATFNQFKTSAAEAFLEHHTHYFSDTEIIYDLCPVRHYGLCHQTFLKTEVSIAKLQERTLKCQTHELLPAAMIKRFNSWRCFAKGDLLDLAQSQHFDIFKEAHAFEAALKSTDVAELPLLKKIYINIYLILREFYLNIIRQSCR